eukprot:CAMPEP_0170084482 /NCGR_PEP_ID=MMETSP0019_2-20121128/19676_1 /TAXON_ID=98059 /ORGANISM="Dinobryon sp., Strain UTEXLB2267" /LENGTH=284 /DNA_ID=CAMNT_0010300609 /DNA_START=137 /DNA_END=988 /DNA_ORIENTATION=-
MSYIVDFDANLLHPHLSDSASKLMEDAQSVGVKVFVVPGTDMQDSCGVLEMKSTLAENFNIIATCGVHPYNAEKVPISFENKSKLESFVQDSRCAAVGECGLDYSTGFPDKSFQLEWFRFQIDLALQYNKPLYFHVRDATEDFLNTLHCYEFQTLTSPECESRLPCVVHCFTGTIEELRIYTQMGFYIGLTGYIFGLSDEQLRAILDIITLDRLVIETDAPYMGFPGCRYLEVDKTKKKKYPNVPSALVKVLERIVSVSGWDKDTVMRKTTENAFKVLRVDPTS